MKDYLNKKGSSKELTKLRSDVALALEQIMQESVMRVAEDITEAITPHVQNADGFEDTMTLYAMIAVYVAMRIETKSAREALIKILGGRPQGEVQLRFYEEKLSDTVCKLLEDHDMTGLGFKES